MPRNTPGYMWGACVQCPYSGRLKDGVCRICRAAARDARKRAKNAEAKRRAYRVRRARARTYPVCSQPAQLTSSCAEQGRTESASEVAAGASGGAAPAVHFIEGNAKAT